MLLLALNEVDKKIRFHKVLGVEYMMKMGKYSNLEYVAKSWVMMIIALMGLFVAFFRSIYLAIHPQPLDVVSNKVTCFEGKCTVICCSCL